MSFPILSDWQFTYSLIYLCYQFGSIKLFESGSSQPFTERRWLDCLRTWIARVGDSVFSCMFWGTGVFVVHWDRSTEVSRVFGLLTFGIVVQDSLETFLSCGSLLCTKKSPFVDLHKLLNKLWKLNISNIPKNTINHWLNN